MATLSTNDVPSTSRKVATPFMDIEAPTTSSTPQTIIIDTGSWNIKAGFRGTHEFPQILPANSEDYKWENVQGIKWRLPIMLAYVEAEEHGIKNVSDKNFELIWKCIILNTLEVRPDKYPVLLSEDPMTTSEQRKEMAEIMFEKLYVPALFITSNAALSMNWTGRNTGTVVDCGHSVTTIVPFYNFQTLRSQARKLTYGGEDVTKYLKYQLARRGKRQFTLKDNSQAATDEARDIKEALCYISKDANNDYYPIEMTADGDVVWSLSDKKLLKFSTEFFSCTESLFRPFLFGKFVDGLHTEVRNVIESCPKETRMHLYEHILLCGGGSMFESLRDRFSIQLSRIKTTSRKINVVAPSNRDQSAWLGGNKMASTDVFHNRLLASKSEYDECGESVFQRKACRCSFS